MGRLLKMVQNIILFSLCSFSHVLVNYHLGCVPKNSMCEVMLCSKTGENTTSDPCFSHKLPAVASVEGLTIDTRSMSMGYFFRAPLTPPIYLVNQTASCNVEEW